MKLKEQASMFTRKKGAVDLKQVPATILMIGIAVMIAVMFTIVLVTMGENAPAETWYNGSEYLASGNQTAQINAGKETITKILTFFVIIGTVIGAVIMIRLLTKAF